MGLNNALINGVSLNSGRAVVVYAMASFVASAFISTAAIGVRAASGSFVAAATHTAAASVTRYATSSASGSAAFSVDASGIRRATGSMLAHGSMLASAVSRKYASGGLSAQATMSAYGFVGVVYVPFSATGAMAVDSAAATYRGVGAFQNSGGFIATPRVINSGAGNFQCVANAATNPHTIRLVTGEMVASAFVTATARGGYAGVAQFQAEAGFDTADGVSTTYQGIGQFQAQGGLVVAPYRRGVSAGEFQCRGLVSVTPRTVHSVFAGMGATSVAVANSKAQYFCSLQFIAEALFKPAAAKDGVDVVVFYRPPDLREFDHPYEVKDFVRPAT